MRGSFIETVASSLRVSRSVTGYMIEGGNGHTEEVGSRFELTRPADGPQRRPVPLVIDVVQPEAVSPRVDCNTLSLCV